METADSRFPCCIPEERHSVGETQGFIVRKRGPTEALRLARHGMRILLKVSRAHGRTWFRCSVQLAICAQSFACTTAAKRGLNSLLWVVGPGPLRQEGGTGMTAMSSSSTAAEAGIGRMILETGIETGTAAGMKTETGTGQTETENHTGMVTAAETGTTTG